jgi:predicted transposase/invertase (TIGR01784 family)
VRLTHPTRFLYFILNLLVLTLEVKQTAFRIDGVFLPKQGEEHPIYFAEVQFQVDLEIYSRLFSEVNLYLRQNKPTNDWRGVVVYPNRNIDRANTLHYHECFESQRVTCIYLNELGDNTSLPIGVATIKLIVEEGDNAIAPARELIARTQQANIPEVQQQKLLEIIETILVYKFPRMSKKEIEAMFGLSDLEKTRVYQEAREEGREEIALTAISRLIARNFSSEQIAEVLGLSIEEVTRLIGKLN